MRDLTLAEFARTGFEILEREDPALHDLLAKEHARQNDSLIMVAAASVVDPSTAACEATATGNVTTEGYPGARFHAGCEYIDEIERLAVARARSAFRAEYANVQPHSGTSANEIIMFNLLKPGDTLLGLDINSGGHLTHGAKASVSGQYFNAVSYGLDERGYIDYEQVAAAALEHRPRLIICGASAYPRTIDFKRFREIADRVGAYLLADISHVAGLVVAGQHPSPIDDAHFTTTSTYKQLFGPRGGLILMGDSSRLPSPRDSRLTLADMIQRAVFPFFQGTPSLGTIAAKARCLAMVTGPEFKRLAELIVADARMLAGCFVEMDYKVLTGGTDNHLLLMDVAARGLTGLVAERALEECRIIVNKNRIPGDTRPALVTSGVRIGTNSLAARGMGTAEMPLCAELVDRVLSSVIAHSETTYSLPRAVREQVTETVGRLCKTFPLPRYPSPAAGPGEGIFTEMAVEAPRP